MKEDGVLDETCKDMEKVKKIFQKKLLDMLGLRKISTKVGKLATLEK